MEKLVACEMTVWRAGESSSTRMIDKKKGAVAQPQGVDKVVTHFVEEGRTSLVAYGSRPGSSVRKLFVPKSSKTAAHVTGF